MPTSDAVRFVSSSGRRQRAQSRRNRWRNGGPCVRQNRVVLAVVATVKPWRMRHLRQPARCRQLSPGRGRPEGTRLPGEHGISRPTTAQGRPSDWLHLYAAVRSPLRSIRAADRGCQPAPGLPCTLLDQEGHETRQSSGETGRENESSCPLFERRDGRVTGNGSAARVRQAFRMNWRSGAPEVPVRSHQWQEHDPPGVRGSIAHDRETFAPSSRTRSSDRCLRSTRWSDWSPAAE